MEAILKTGSLINYYKYTSRKIPTIYIKHNHLAAFFSEGLSAIYCFLRTFFLLLDYQKKSIKKCILAPFFTDISYIIEMNQVFSEILTISNIYL